MLFAQPLWIIAGLFCCAAVYLAQRIMERKRHRALQRFAAKNLLGNLTRNVSLTKRKLKQLLLIAAIFCCFIALARPQYGHRWIDVKRKGIDILFAIDTSNSMLAEDVQPNRLDRSKYAILDFVNQLEGDRVGLMPFAGSSFLMCPLTVDYAAFEQSLQAVDTSIIPTPGTNIAQAVRYAESILKNDANHKLLIIITDGENLDGDVLQAAADAAEKKMTIFTVGVGTAAGELIPITIDGKQAFVKDQTGNFVTSRLDEESLLAIGEKTGGLYAPLGNKGQGLETIYNQKLALIPKEELAEKRQKVPVERFPWALGAALILFLLEFLLNSHRKNGSASKLNGSMSFKYFAATAVFYFICFQTVPSTFASPGEEAFNSNDFLGASEFYQKALEKDPDDVVLNYNYGSTAYKNNLYDEAISSFNKALLSNDLELQRKAYFNRGNAQFRKGEESQQADPQKTIDAWQNALESYNASLQLQPENDVAKKNHDLVKQRLEELKKQQQQNNKNNSSEKDSGEENQDKTQEQKDKNKQNQEGTPQNQGDEDKQPDNRDTPSEKKDDEKSGNEPTEQQQENSAAPSAEAEQKDDNRQNADNSDSQERKLGEMSREEAEQLLNEIKNEEGMLNFIPQKESNADKLSGRNW